MSAIAPTCQGLGLDERERQLRDRAWILSYQVLSAVVLGVVIVLGILVLGVGRPVTLDAGLVNAMVLCVAVLLPVLPSAALAWIEPDAPAETRWPDHPNERSLVLHNRLAVLRAERGLSRQDLGMRSPSTTRPSATWSAASTTPASISRSARRTISACRWRRYAELQLIAVRLLEVVTHDLLELAEPVAGGALQPVGHALVEDGPLRLGKGLVRSVADQDVAEAEGVAEGQLGAIRSQQLLAHQGEQPPAQVACRLPLLEVGQCRHLEALRPMTAARCATRRSASGSPSSRAASRA